MPEVMAVLIGPPRVEGAAVNGLPVVDDRPRVLADQIVGDFKGAGGTGLGVVLEHFSPAGDTDVGGDFDEDPGVFEDESLDFGDLDRFVRGRWGPWVADMTGFLQVSGYCWGL